jgi:hypothetical protein
MNQLTLPLCTLTQTEAEAEIIFSAGVTASEFVRAAVLARLDNGEE